MAGAEVVTRYFDAVAARDLDRAAACWRPDGVDHMIGEADLRGPEGVRQWFASLFSAFPDWQFEVLETATEGNRTAVRWRARATFAGPGTFQGFEANGARIEVEGCDMLHVGDDGLIESNYAYVNAGDVARQLGLLPDPESPAGERLAGLANLRTRMMKRVKGADVERVAHGVWVVRGGFPVRGMNVYLIDDGDGLAMFDAGISGMAEGVLMAAARLGKPITRVVLGHADADHRGSAGRIGAPIFCHPAERAAAESASPFRDYFDLSKFRYPHSRPFYRRALPVWDGGALQIADTVSEGDEVAGFRVYEFPGHAPGLIGLVRESDRLALVSDTVYTINAETFRPQLPAVPHPAFDLDVGMARASIQKLAQLEPSAVWAGHAAPVTHEVVFQLERAASAPL